MSGVRNGVRSHPVPVSGLTNVVGIAAGADHALALLKNGTVMAWGDNDAGELGNGGVVEESYVPMPVEGIHDAVALAANEFTSMALLENGEVLTWGDNSIGELGLGSSLGPEDCSEYSEWPCSTVPRPVRGIGVQVQHIAAGEWHDIVSGPSAG